MHTLAILFSIFGNVWIYKIGQESLVVLLVCLAAATSFIFYLSQKNKYSPYFVLFSFLALIFIQLRNFEPIKFAELSNDEARVRDERLSLYSADVLRLGYYLEAKPEVVATRRVFKSFLKEFDLNAYFFAGHPRERLGVKEFEKFPYILLPVFLFGAYEAVKKKKHIFGLFIIPLLIIASDKNSEFPKFALFPFFTSLIYLGLVQSIKLINKNKRKNYLYAFFAVIYFLVMVQIISYEVF